MVEYCGIVSYSPELMSLLPTPHPVHCTVQKVYWKVHTGIEDEGRVHTGIHDEGRVGSVYYGQSVMDEKLESYSIAIEHSYSDWEQ